MKNRKRILAALLAVVMTFSMLPASAFAAEPGGAAADNDADPVIVSNEEYEAEPAAEDISDQTAQQEAEVETSSEEAGDNEAAEPEADPAAEPETQPEAEPGTEPETQPEVIPSSEPEEVQPAQTENEAPEAEETAETTEEAAEPVILTYEGRDYMVTATFDPSAFPAGVQMKAREIRKSNSGYQDLYDQALETVQKETEEEVEITHARFFDITFYTEEEDNIEPDGTVNVNIKYTRALTVESTDDISVLHFDEKKEEPQLMEIETSGSRDDKVDEISFDTESFSVYAVIATEQTGNDARLTVNFYGKDTAADAAPIATMYVRTSDRADSDKMAEIVYDPEGELNLPDGYVFYGKWSVGNTNYSEITDGITIQQVRDYISNPNEIPSFAEGDVLNVYAVLFRNYTVRYLNRDGSTVGVDSVLVKNGETSKAYTVYMEYSDDDNHHFEGWSVTEGQDNISYANDTPPENGLHVNGLDVSISGDVEFSVVSPEGRWLIFNENGKHATYNAARFVYWGTNADFSNMKPMTRPGYTFAGWWTGPPSEYGEAPTGAEYDTENPGPITQTTTLYAKWDYSGLVEYSVVIWKEHAYDDGYEVGEIIHFEGQPFTEINTVIGHNTEGDNNAYVTVGGVNKVNTTIQALGDESKDPYEGFHLKTYDKNVIIEPTGDTVLNVYYDRNEYTLKFTHLALFTETITAKYGAHIGNKFPISPGILSGAEEYFLSWYPNSSPCYIYPQGISHDIRYIDKMPAENINFRSHSLGNVNAVQIRLYYYAEVLPGQTADRTFDGKGFKEYRRPIYLKDLLVIYDEQFSKMEGFDRYGTDTNNNDHANMSEHGSYEFPWYEALSGRMYFFYTRNKYDLHFADGSYFDGNGNLMDEPDRGVLKTVEQILYEEDLSSYNKNGADYFDPSAQAPEGFVFEGWYIDKKCTVPYTFTTMAINGITVYAKWRQIQYRVFLHPNAGTSESNPKEPFGPNQEMNFRVSYGDSISAPDGNWKGYKFLGWYLDKELTNQVYSQNILMNKDTPTSVYNKETDMTDPMDKWGILGSSPTNSDAANNRFWITQRYDLYAKWSRVLTGSEENGMYVKYWAEEDGITVPVDNVSHADNSEVVAALAPAEAPDGQVFRKWIVQVWNGSEFIDTDPIVDVEPGKKFTVHSEGAKIVVTGSNPEEVVAEADLDENGHYTYIVQLRADFADAEKASTTFIHWFKNYEDDEQVPYHTDTLVNGTKLAVNQAVGIPEAPKFIGHDFLGWAKVSMGADADAAETWMEHTDNYVQDLDADDLFLYYRKVEEDGIEVGKFYSDSSFQNEVTQVAADATAYEAMFAVWKKSTYTIILSSDEEHPITCEMEVTRKGSEYTVDKIDLLKDYLSAGYMYGGYYHYDEDEGKGQAFEEPGDALVPVEGETYYLKEVNVNYLKPQLYIVYSAARVLSKMYGIINVDSQETEGTVSDYRSCGLMVSKTGDENSEPEVFDIDIVSPQIDVSKNGTVIYSIDYSNFGSYFNKNSCLNVGYADISDYIIPGAELEIKAFFITKDGFLVTGAKTRKILFAGNEDDEYVRFTGWTSSPEGGNTKTGIVSGDPPYPVFAEQEVPDDDDTDGDGKGRTLGFARSLKLVLPEDKITYTVKKFDGTEELDPQTVEPGARSGEINYPEKDGYLFTGWFQDEALSVPADFSDVQGDMTVYAGYIPKKDVTLSLARKTGKTGDVTFTATVSIKNTNKFREVGVFCDHSGETTEEALTKKTYVNVGSTSSPKYTYKFSGPVEVKSLAATDSFTASVYWVTKDGTRVREAARTCTYKGGSVKVQN